MLYYSIADFKKNCEDLIESGAITFSEIDGRHAIILDGSKMEHREKNAIRNTLRNELNYSVNEHGTGCYVRNIHELHFKKRDYKFKKFERKIINEIALNYLAEQPEGDYFDAIKKLELESEFGNGINLASNYVNVNEDYENYCINEILFELEHNLSFLQFRMNSKFFRDINFFEFKLQKAILKNKIEKGYNELKDIYDFYELIQDYLVNEIGWDENFVYY